VLGVHNGAYHYVARVTAKVDSRECSEALWGQDDGGRTWQLMYFLDRPKEINIPYGSLVPDLPAGYQGFFKPSAASLAALESKYGSVDAFVEEKLLNANTSLPCFLVRSNEGTDYGDQIGKIYAYSSTVPNYTKMANGANVVVDRKTRDGVRLLGWGGWG